MATKYESRHETSFTTIFTGAQLNAGLASNAYLLNVDDLTNGVPVNTNRMVFLQLEFVIAWGGAPTAGKAIGVWLLRNGDSGNVESGSSSVVPARPRDGEIRHNGTTAAHRTYLTLPNDGILNCRILLFNDGIGQTPTTASSVRARYVTRKLVDTLA